MLLRMSGQAQGIDVDLPEIVDVARSPDPDRDFGVPGGAELREFALAIHGRRGVSEARARLLAALGPDAVSAAAGVVGAFEAVNRIADATGTRLDDMMAGALQGPLSGLGLESLRRD